MTPHEREDTLRRLKAHRSGVSQVAIVASSALILLGLLLLVGPFVGIITIDETNPDKPIYIGLFGLFIFAVGLYLVKRSRN